jgi:hypothetical protein
VDVPSWLLRGLPCRVELRMQGIRCRSQLSCCTEILHRFLKLRLCESHPVSWRHIKTVIVVLTDYHCNALAFLFLWNINGFGVNESKSEDFMAVITGVKERGKGEKLSNLKINTDNSSSLQSILFVPPHNILEPVLGRPSKKESKTTVMPKIW